MTEAPIISCVWTGEAFAPASPFHARRAREHYGEGEAVEITEADNQRSTKSHSHFFATVAEYWRTLPESLSAAPYAASPDALRKHALIVLNYRDTQTVDAGSKAAAERIAPVMSALANAAHGYSITAIRGPMVQIATPESQSYRAMGKARFQESKDAVLGWIEALLEGRDAA